MTESFDPDDFILPSFEEDESLYEGDKEIVKPDPNKPGKRLMRFHEEVDYRMYRGDLPNGYEHKDMETLIGLIQLVWLERGTRATLDDILLLTNWSRTKCINGMSSKALYWRLRKRGIDWPKKWTPETNRFGELTPQQLMTIQILTDPTRTEPFRKRLTIAGINYNVYRNWMRQPKFADAMRVVSEQMIQDNVSTVHNTLVKKAEAGDMKAVDLFYQVSGRHDPMRQQTQDLTKIVGLLLEVLTRHVTDTTVLTKINNDFTKVLSGDNVSPVGELEAHVPDEIVDAEVVTDSPVDKNPPEGFFDL